MVTKAIYCNKKVNYMARLIILILIPEFSSIYRTVLLFKFTIINLHVLIYYTMYQYATY
jgi:hypothetical protein